MSNASQIIYQGNKPEIVEGYKNGFSRLTKAASFVGFMTLGWKMDNMYLLSSECCREGNGQKCLQC